MFKALVWFVLVAKCHKNCKKKFIKRKKNLLDWDGHKAHKIFFYLKCETDKILSEAYSCVAENDQPVKVCGLFNEVKLCKPPSSLTSQLDGLRDLQWLA